MCASTMQGQDNAEMEGNHAVSQTWKNGIDGQ